MLVDQEFIEVPTHCGIECAVFRFVAQPTIQRVLFAAFDIELFADGESDSVIFLTERSDFCCCAGFLVHELVARTADDDELIGEFF